MNVRGMTRIECSGYPESEKEAMMKKSNSIIGATVLGMVVFTTACADQHAVLRYAENTGQQAVTPGTEGSGGIQDEESISKNLQLDPKTRGIHVEKSQSEGSTQPVPVLPSINLDIPFEFNSSRMSYAGMRQADELGKAINKSPRSGVRLQVIGHTDAVGPADYNQVLSERRAEAVVEYLVNRWHVSPDRLVSSGRGETQLLYPDRPADGANRRVQVVNIGG